MKNLTSKFPEPAKKSKQNTTLSAKLFFVITMLLALSAPFKLLAQAPTINYSSPQTYITGTAISPLTPTASGVAAQAYNSTPLTIGSGFNSQLGVAVDAAGNVYVIDGGLDVRLTKIPGDGGMPVSFLTGYMRPKGIATDAAGNVYVANYFFGEVLELHFTQITLASGFSSLQGIAVDGAGNVYVIDGNDVKKIPAGGGTPVTVGSGFDNPSAIAVDAAGNIYVTEYREGAVKKIPGGSGTPVTVGSGFNAPNGVAVDAAGNVFVDDAGNSAIKEIPAAGGAPVTIASGFNSPIGVAVDAAGNVYVNDSGNHAIKKIIPAGGYYTGPFLPAGLTINNNTGVISGTPTVASPATNYTVTAYNPAGSDTAIVNIKIVASTNNATLSNLDVSSGTLTPSFAGSTTSYTASVSNAISSITVTPTTNDAGAAVKVNGTAIASGSASGSLPLSVGPNTITTIVTAQDGTTTKIYTVTVTRDKAAQTITFNSLPAVNYGSADFAPGTTVSSGLPISYSSSNTSVATIANGKIHITGAGSATITASQNGDPNYHAAPDASQVLTVNTVPLTITANNQSKVYGQANPVLTVSYLGFVNGENESNLSALPTVTSTALTGSPVGSYPITTDGAVDPNYTISYIPGILTVTVATRTITFNPIPLKTYKDADFSSGATASSGETIIYNGYDPNVVTITNGIVHITGAGATTITATVAANSNYSSTPSVSQALLVDKAHQTILIANIPHLLTGSQYDLSLVSASSGLPVTFTTADPMIASVNGQTLNALHIGITSLTASQPGDNNFYAAAIAGELVNVGDAAGDEIFVQKAVSPNGDGINDSFLIEGIKSYPDNQVTIVNRNGAKIYETTGYDNAYRVFDGHSNITGALQEPGTYFYVITYTVNGATRHKTGYLVLKYR